MHVLLKIRLDDARQRVTDGPVLGNQCERAMFDLLKQVRNTIRRVDFDITSSLVNRRLIPPNMEMFPRMHQIEHGGVLGLRPYVEVAGIEPATDVQSRDMLSRLKSGVSGRTLSIQVEMLMVDRSLECIVKM